MFLDCDDNRTVLPFLPLDAVGQRIQYIKDYYRRDDIEITELIEHPYVYLTQAQIDNIVHAAASCLNHIYIALRHGLPAGDVCTALDLPL